jgi:hypothetical protein
MADSPTGRDYGRLRFVGNVFRDCSSCVDRPRFLTFLLDGSEYPLHLGHTIASKSTRRI